ncbi:MAG: CapA family protein [Clostridia bacterium]|nr:CapA family protein [Clostridia bacterium]
MKIMFGSDVALYKMNEFPGVDKVKEAMAEPAEVLHSADFSMINAECVFGKAEDGEPIPKTGPNLAADEEFVAYIDALKPDILGMANNHSMDFGATVFHSSRKLLESKGYTCIGAGDNTAEAYKPAVLEKDGMKIAIIAVCENEFGAATATECGTAGYSLGECSRAIFNALKQGQKPVMYFHGGNEYNPFPSPMKTELYRHFIDIGAEAVIAMHTHCPQGFEMYNGKPIVYSMGNLFFPYDFTRENQSWYYGYMSEVDFSEEGVGLNIHPYTFTAEKITMLKGEEKEKFMKYMECLNEPLDKPEEIQKWFDAFCTTQAHYVNSMHHYVREFFADGNREIRDFLAVKNLFNCEAHNELVRRCLNLVYENKLEASKERVPLIKKLQNIECI